MKTLAIKIDNAIVELIDHDSIGRGQIRIHAQDKTYAHYWGAMGTNIVDFVARIDLSYFLNKLNPHDYGIFCPRQTLKNIRKFIRNEVPWYQDTDAQKKLREDLKEIEGQNENLALHVIASLRSDDALTDRLQDAINTLKSDPWHFFVRKASAQEIWLSKLFCKLQRRLRRLINGQY
jgi:hypothetical protein